MTLPKTVLAAALATTTLYVCASPAKADDTPECNNSTHSAVTEPELTLECGTSSSVTGDLGTAVGGQATAAVEGTAVGLNASAAAAGTALGISATTTADAATAVGAGAHATAENSVALGAGSTATEANTVSVGSTTVQRRITNVADGVNATDAATVGQMQAGHSAIQGQVAALAAHHDDRLTALEGLALDVHADLRQLDRKIAGSTATAIAMGGAAFLPGKRVNLTGNVATYDGAVAGALQVGALVSDSFAVSAGVATNFNKRGEVGARAGFTFGW